MSVLCLPLWWCVVSRCGSFVSWWVGCACDRDRHAVANASTQTQGFPCCSALTCVGLCVCVLCVARPDQHARSRLHTGFPCFRFPFCVFLCVVWCCRLVVVVRHLPGCRVSPWSSAACHVCLPVALQARATAAGGRLSAAVVLRGLSQSCACAPSVCFVW